MSAEEYPSVTRRLEIKPYKDSGLDPMTLYVTVMLCDGRPAKLFLYANESGSLERGLLRAIGQQSSDLLDHGVPIAEIVARFRGSVFPPGGRVEGLPDPLRGSPHTDVTSPLDAIARWIGQRWPEVSQ